MVDDIKRESPESRIKTLRSELSVIESEQSELDKKMKTDGYVSNTEDTLYARLLSDKKHSKEFELVNYKYDEAVKKSQIK